MSGVVEPRVGRHRLAALTLPDALAAHAVLLLATLLVAARWAVPGLLLPVELVQDASGHMAAAQALRDHLLPSLSGWNPDFFAGFPQDRAYPPLAHALLALLGLALPLGVALRVVLATAVLATPLAAATFARSRGLPRGQAAVYALLVTTLLCVTPGGGAMQLAGSFASLYNVGLTANAVALPLLLLAAAALPRALASRRGTLRAALLVSAAALTHLVCGLALALLCLCETAAAAATRGRRPGRTWRHAGRLGLGCLVLTAVWLVPFGNELGYGGVSHIASGTPLWVLLPAVAALCVHAAQRRRDRRASRRQLGVLLFTLTLAVLLCLGDSVRVPMHLYRLHLFVLLGAALCCVSGIAGRRALTATAMLAAAAAIGFSVQGPALVDLRGRDTLIVPEGPPPARVLVAASPLHQVSCHYLQFEYPRRSGSAGLQGLFVESTPLARWVADLTAAIESSSNLWGVSWDVETTAAIAQGLAPEAATRDPAAADRAAAVARRLLHEFGVDAVLTDRRLPASVVSDGGPVVYLAPAKGDADPRYEIQDDQYVFRLRSVTGGARLAEPLTEPLQVHDQAGRPAWDVAVHDWLLVDQAAGRPVVARAGLDTSAADATASVLACTSSPDGRDIRLDVEAPADVPVLVRVAWHPHWRASADGREIAVDRVAPGFCMVRGRGRIELRWRPSAAERLAAGVSATGWLLACAWAGRRSLKLRRGPRR